MKNVKKITKYNVFDFWFYFHVLVYKCSELIKLSDL